MADDTSLGLGKSRLTLVSLGDKFTTSLLDSLDLGGLLILGLLISDSGVLEVSDVPDVEVTGTSTYSDT